MWDLEFCQSCGHLPEIRIYVQQFAYRGVGSLKPINGLQAKNLECLPRTENVIWIKPGHELGVCDYYLLARMVVVSSCGQPRQFAKNLRVSLGKVSMRNG